MASVLGHAQTGSIQGTVTDKSGAVVQDADVVVTNLDTNQARTVKTNDTGGYSLPTLPPGPYSLTISKNGFRTFKVDKVSLSVAQAMSVNAELEAGATSEEVQVRGDELPPVDLETAQVSNLVDSRQMQELPLITRDPYSLVLLSPGTSQTNANGGFSVNGGRDRNNNFLLDGVDNNDTSVPGIPDGLLSANPDSTQEFRVITDNFNPEYGRNTGAIIDVVTKSGTNAFHGGVREFGRWNSFGGARDWFNPRVDPASGQLNPMNPYVRNQFGFNFGGPIIKNKTFFFVDSEFQRFRTTLTESVVAPTAAFKQSISGANTGIFQFTGTDLTTGQPSTVGVDLSPSGVNNPGGFPIDPRMQSIFDLYPTATQSSDGISGIVHFPSSSRLDAYNPIVKIDHQFTSKHSLSMRYAYNHSFDPNPFHDEILPNAVGGVNSKQITQGANAHLTSTLKPTLINDFVFGWNRLFAFFGCDGTSVLDSVSPLDQFGNGIDYNMGPFTSFGCTNLVANDQWRRTGTLSYGDDLTWSRGSHLFKFGADFRNVGEQGPNNFLSRRQLSLNAFTGDGVSLIDPPTNGSGHIVDSAELEDAASALYGFVWEDLAGQFYDKNGVRKATDNKLFRQHEYDFYGQDTWKVRRNLTLTYGLRYQLYGVPYEENANFSNLLTDPSSFQTGQSVTFTTVGPGTGHSLYKQDYSNIEPRFGISWDPWSDGKTAVRGAFGIFHDRVFGNLFGNARGNPPFEQDRFDFPFNVVTGGVLPVAPPSLPQPPSATVADETGLGPVVFDTNFPNLVSNNWNLDIQRQLPGGNVIDIAYVGAESHHLYRQVDGNPPDPALVKRLLSICQPGNPLNTTGCTTDDVAFTNLYFGAEFGVLPFNAVNNNALFQPFYQRSVGNGIYNGLQTKFTHRMSHGLQLEGAYTWAHSIDDAPDPLVPAAGNRTFPRNSRNLGEERGNSDYDIRHRLVVNYIYEMPFGKGKGVLNHGVAGKIFEGWQFSGITTWQTGHPFDIYSSTDMERTGLSGRADLVPGQNPYDQNAPGATTYATTPAAIGEKIWFSNAGAFSGRTDGSGAPTYVGPGTVGRNNFYGPSFVNFDLAWAKSTNFGERVRLQLRVECFNIFNHPQFDNPVNGITSTNFGLITDTLSQPDGTTSARQIQVGAKLTF
ncbi:MAG TPA: TonB-dependent receptor [Terriglobales bacterium]|nr:TonB-dependent receptor [Terriglobales bacterium]